MLETAARDSRLSVRERVPEALSSEDNVWARNLLEDMLTDRSPIVREEAQKLLDDWDIRKGIMEPFERRRRVHMAAKAKRSNVDARREVVEELTHYEATWARKLAEDLAGDPDAKVSSAAQQWLRDRSTCTR